MVRIGMFITAAALSLSLGAAIEPAHAQSPSYRAVPTTAVASGNVIVDGVMWRCGTDGCVASNATARPAILCAQAARKIGKIESFSFGTQTLDAEALTKCNAKAKA